MIRKIFMVAVVAVAASATTLSAKAQNTAPEGSSEAAVVSDNRHSVKCPSCGADVVWGGPKYGRRGHAESDSIRCRKPGMHGRHGKPGKHCKPEQMPVRPEVGAVVEVLPDGARASKVADGKQSFWAFGVRYEPMVVDGAIRYKVVEVKDFEHKHHIMNEK